MDTEPGNNLQYGSGSNSGNGYQSQEAWQFIEFCVELNNQDDRLKDGNDSDLRARVDPDLWNPEPVYDSRRAVAGDVIEFRALDPAAQEKHHWSRMYKGIISRAQLKYGGGWGVETIFADPDLNGFGPWQNAWLLYEGRGAFAGCHAIAVRGTVFSNPQSDVEDVIFNPVSAKEFLSPVVRFADTAEAALHSGLAHATFTLLLDDKYGVLRALNAIQADAKSRLYIVGHSQGAAMATMAHAFMHYAMHHDSSADQPAFGLQGMNYRLKSYVFAQPKPGNYVFGSDFARITQHDDSAIVINNHIDPVPKVPLTLQATGDLGDAFRGGALWAKALRFVSGLGSKFRGAVSFVVEPFVRKSARGYGYFYNYESIGPIGKEQVSSSWNFTSAGHVVMVFGTPDASDDPFFQHHATTYRKLVRSQLAH